MTSDPITSKKILAAADQWDVIDLLSNAVHPASLILATTADQALEQADSQSFDLALIDLGLPGSLDLLTVLVHQAVPSIVLTQKGNTPEKLTAAVKKGALAYVAKRHLDRLPDLIRTILTPSPGTPAWQLLYDRLDKAFDLKFGRRDPRGGKTARGFHFWDGFEMNWNISKGIQERLRHNPDIIGRGI